MSAPRFARCARCHAPVHSPGLCGECRKLERWARDQRRGLETVEMFPDLKPAPRNRHQGELGV